MAITYYMLQIPMMLLFFLLVLCFGLLAALITFLFRKYVRVKILRSHNEVTGFFFLAIASLYSLLIGFVVYVVWGQLIDIETNVSREGSSAISLYRDIKFYPDTQESKRMMKVYLNFVYDVVDDEFPKMKLMKKSHRTAQSFNNLYYTIEHLNPKTPFQIQLVAELFNHLNELDTFRGMRTSSLDAEIQPFMWLPIMFGALITIICGLFLDIEHLRMHIALNTLLGAFIGMLLFIIILLDHPFTGSISIKPKSYLEIFTLEKWVNDHQTKNISNAKK
jgi:hypothetical protein